MGIDRFTKEEFEAALPKDSGNRPLWEAHTESIYSSELEYVIPVHRADGDFIRIRIRSSVDPTSGIAKDTGKDSIRIWLEGGDQGENYVIFRSLGKPKQRYITRVSGWQERLTEKLRELYVLGKKVNRCPVCREWKVLRNVKKEGGNKGRVFSVCKNCEDAGKKNNQFVWVTEKAAS